MPRAARLDAPGVLDHIIIRGIERRKIFRDAKDRENLLERLGSLLSETNTACYAWALVPNHAHFLLRTGEVAVATVMRRLHTGYVVSFNRRHRRHGHLLQNRYKSIICQEEPYFKELVRYPSAGKKPFLLLGGARVGNITYGFGERLRDEPGSGRICCAERRGDRARAQLPTHPVSYVFS
jgi:REP element-mobilizing transposase RayT